MKGQTLIEVLIAIAVGAIVFVGAVSTLAPSTKITKQTAAEARAAALQKELFQDVTSWSAGNWNGLLSLSTGSANPYYLLTTSSPFTAATGTQTITSSSTIAVTRYFYVGDVERDASGQIVSSGGTNDPSTKEITVVAYSASSTLVPTTSISFYLTNNTENVLVQSNWSTGGSTSSQTTVTSTYATSSNLNTTGALTLNSTSSAGAISSSSPDYFGWTDLIGWLDFWNGGSGATVTSQGLTGYASSSAGPISLDCHTTGNGNICSQSTYQVANNGNGILSSYAWSDPYGWVSFEGTSPSYGVTIGSTGTFSGYAWNPVFGWLSVNCANNGSCANAAYRVQTTWTPSSTTSGSLESATFDTGSNNSSHLNSVVWQGTPSTCSGCVEFQFATSNSSSGPWNASNFTGPDGTPNTYWDPQGAGVPLSLGYSYTGFRYFRYIIYLTPSGGTSPDVTGISISWGS